MVIGTKATSWTCICLGCPVLVYDYRPILTEATGLGVSLSNPIIAENAQPVVNNRTLMASLR